MHAKLSSCPLQAILADFEDAATNIEEADTRRELNLVADALRLGGAILTVYPDMLASQLIGRLLPEIDGNPSITFLFGFHSPSNFSVAPPRTMNFLCRQQVIVALAGG